MGIFAGESGYLIVDAHVHVTPGEMTVFGWRKFTAEDALQRMDSCGIDKAVIQPKFSGGEPDRCSKGHDYIADCVSKYPNRFTGVCRVDPLSGDFAVEELRRCVQVLGMRMLKLIPKNFFADSEVVYPLVEEAKKLGIPVMIHSDFAMKYCTPFLIKSLAERFPDITIVMSHYGMDPDMLGQLTKLIRRNENLVADQTATPDAPEKVFTEPARLLGPERVVWGSDLPVLSPECALVKLEVASKVREQANLDPLTDEEVRLILGENMARILGLK